MRLTGTSGLEKYWFGYLEVGFHGYLGVKGPGKRQKDKLKISLSCKGYSSLSCKGCIRGRT